MGFHSLPPVAAQAGTLLGETVANYGCVHTAARAGPQQNLATDYYSYIVAKSAWYRCKCSHIF